MKPIYAPVDPKHIKREKEKARELRKSNWWKKKLQDGECYHCGQKFSPEELTLDHLIPVGRGGHSDKNNCVPSCKPCNSKKGSQTSAEFLSTKE